MRVEYVSVDFGWDQYNLTAEDAILLSMKFDSDTRLSLLLPSATCWLK